MSRITKIGEAFCEDCLKPACSATSKECECIVRTGKCLECFEAENIRLNSITKQHEYIVEITRKVIHDIYGYIDVPEKTWTVAFVSEQSMLEWLNDFFNQNNRATYFYKAYKRENITHTLPI